MANKKALVTAATGFMGGSFLAQLLASTDPRIKELSFSTLVRKQEQADVLAAQGVNAILFSGLDDTDFLRRVASEHDIVIHSAHGFHTASSKALIEGLAERKKATGQDVFFIQTSGTSNLGDFPITKRHVHPPGRVFRDRDENIYRYMVSREAETPYGQRTTDVAVVETGKATGVKTYIVMSPIVYGAGLSKSFKNQSFKNRSFHGPFMIQSALAKGQAVYVGDGAEEWGHVHIEDLAAFYEILVSKLLAGEDLPEGEHGVYFASSGTHTWKEFAEATGKAGYEVGALKTPEAVSVPPTAEVFVKLLGGFGTPEQAAMLAEVGFASRAVTDAQLARSLGWKPRKTDEDWWASIREEFPVIWAQTKAQGQ